ncbi:aminotransferase class III-fold pyridoxal phosphate-dependent enzyme [Gilvibacter sediminis]|uniref:aminotransferase class III-fold pyridoxal phosphate-dependent enzyme n=1 Tax=Gilvibacter sediminis TaxID=379071 RepID=UPI00234FC477|nr:aminotransferase class III-fold pyridoxal phosphate-dependent enzyme [Gilvibacter sediminis]MDC7997289.1 aminotransferase class III-fold pyridoxal phosphate-dependent enzyme [Gilvibacter sediminis]
MTPAAFSALHKIIKNEYHLEGSLSLLYGEFTLNYKLTTNTGQNFLVKVGPTALEQDTAAFEQALLDFLSERGLQVPQVISTKTGELFSFFTADGQKRSLRIISWIDGKLWSEINPHTESLREQLGQRTGELLQALSDYKASGESLNPTWELSNSLWTQEHLALFDSADQKLLDFFIDRFKSELTTYETLRKQWIHNDLNDNNIFVAADGSEIKGIIDFGDASYSQSINEVAICGAYLISGFPDPLDALTPFLKGVQEFFPLQEAELAHLYTLIGMRLLLSIVHAKRNAIAQPENTYLQVSQEAVWESLQLWSQVHPRFAHYSFRKACGYPAHPKTTAFEQWATEHKADFDTVFPTTTFKKALHLDLSVSSLWIGTQSEFNDLALFEFKIDQLQKQHPEQIIAGGYQEPRPLYTDPAYDTVGNYGAQSRTVHLGVDFWLPAQTPVHTLHKGEVVIAVNDQGNKEYGGLVVIKHQEAGLEFYTLYGHLIPETALTHNLGDIIEAGGMVGQLGAAHENGSWSPHLHYQFMLDLLDYTEDFPGVCYAHQREIWQDLCPDPNLFFQDSALKPQPKLRPEQIEQKRKKSLGQGMSLSYNEPLHIVRGQGIYLVDSWGRKYIDTVNNVAHVGHEHPHVVKAAQQQIAALNTNTRYLHKNVVEFAEAFLKTFPEKLSVVHFVNSGSEANELAVRMVEAVTGSRHMLVSESGYHGNTLTCVDLSHYKFDRKGGYEPPQTTHVFHRPDVFRGKHRGPNASVDYVKDLQEQIQNLQEQNMKIGGLLLESVLSCGGQIPLPEGYLPEVYKLVRAAGGICIADEVQVGMGRLGDSFWGFEQYGVVPDIVTIGKPIGNGHPLAAVVCTAEVAEAFNNGMEFFNTFGGNPVSSAVGKAVLEVIQEEKLMDNARDTGHFLIDGLKALQKQFPIIADVRGKGFFLGFELCDADRNPLTEQAKYLANRMKYYGYLMSVDGPDDNVIKIKPPMVFNRHNAEQLLHYLSQVLTEDKMQHYEA